MTVDTVEVVNVSEDEARRLLAEAKRASDEVSVANRAFLDAAKRRREVVHRAMDAGIPRQRIADALGVSRYTIYDILKGKDTP